MTSALEARDALIGAIRTGWLADGTSAPIPLHYDDVKADPPSTTDAEGRPDPYARVTMRHVGGEQDTLGGVGNRRFMSSGVVTVQLFTAPGDGHALSDALASIVRGILFGLRSPNGVWVFDVSPPLEVGVTGAWFQTNVTATFRYQEVA